MAVPVPGIHDEYGYLLQADTFLHGRLANPPHPLWRSFETFHVNWFPTYSSMFPPAQGFVLAAGKLLGHPWTGVVFSTAAMCAAFVWMLQAWMPPRWAFLGGLIALLKLGLISYWMNSYWGGAVAAAGGALVLGALGRIFRKPRVRDALLLGFGAAILANSRPFEGFILCLPAGIALLLWMRGKSAPPMRHLARRIVAPVALVLVLTAAFMSFYNWRLTGNPLLLPHVLNTRTYHSTPLFLWGHLKPPLRYNNQQFEEFYGGWARDNFPATWKDMLRICSEKITRYWATFLWPGAIFPLLCLPFAFRDRRMRLLTVVAAMCTAGLFSVVWSFPHYAAPVTCVYCALLVQGFRHLRAFRPSGRLVGVALSRAAGFLLLVTVGLGIYRRVHDPYWWDWNGSMGEASRAAIQEKLERTAGKHLILVRYGEDHNLHDEWVFNGADIDGSKVVWARELDRAQNDKLLAYYRSRTVWLAEPDDDPSELLPYEPPEDQEGP